MQNGRASDFIRNAQPLLFILKTARPHRQRTTDKRPHPDGRKGRIEIKLEKKDDVLSLKIADDGIGKSGVVKGTGIGGKLVSLLTRQLGGQMHEKVQGGTIVYLDFKMKKAA